MSSLNDDYPPSQLIFPASRFLAKFVPPTARPPPHEVQSFSDFSVLYGDRKFPSASNMAMIFPFFFRRSDPASSPPQLQKTAAPIHHKGTKKAGLSLVALRRDLSFLDG